MTVTYLKKMTRSNCSVRRLGTATTFLLLIAASAVSLRAQQEKLAQTPPMGWNDWYQYECKISDATMRAQADALVSTGMKAAGYIYVNIDDCWMGKRDAQGNIQPNSNFPDMKALGDYIHSKGLKFGIYTSPGPTTCADQEGSYQHEEQDARTYASWGVDFLKYDWCSAQDVYRPDEMQGAYKKMHDAILRTGRPMVYSLCQYGFQSVWEWGASVGGNMWRTTEDIGGNYRRWSLFAFQNNGLEKYAGPGHWNDPDILLIGIGKTNLDEDRAQMTLWSILAAPLLAGNDLTKMSPEILAILANPEVIAVDQDPNGIQGRRVWQEGPLEVWMKPLSDGSKAVGMFNRSVGPLPVTLRFSDVGIMGKASVRDLWARKDLGVFKDSYTVEIPRYGAAMLKVRP